MKKKQSIEHTQLLVLSLLAGEDMYGYQMIVELARRSERTFEMKEGTLYPLLHTLEKNRWIKSYTKTAENGRERKYYSLTQEGRAHLEYKKQEWAIFSQQVNSVLRTAALPL